MREDKFVSAEEMMLQKEYSNKIYDIVMQMKADYCRDISACIITYGCQQNEEDSEKIAGLLFDMGFIIIENREEADLVIINTCAVREHAEKRALGNLGILKHLKEKNPKMIVGFCGCMAQEKHIEEDMKNKYHHVNMVFGPQAIYRVPEALYTVMAKHQRVFMTDGSDARIFEGVPQLRKNQSSGYVTIMTGCNNFCSYCIVPYVRGRERSREPEQILAEIKDIVSKGYKDITLLGQNVNSYGKDLENGISFAELLRRINDIDGEFRVRFMTSHPKDISFELIDVIADCPKICNHLHLPVQSGNNEMLEKMNRKYTVEDYKRYIDYAKKRIPAITLTSDIIVGFPGETEEMFLDTVDLIKYVGYDMIFSFIFSKRKGTPAYSLPEQIPYDEKLKRYNRLRKVQEEISASVNNGYLGKTMRVLCLERNQKDESLISCRTDGNKLAFVKGDDSLLGKFINVKITEVKTWFMYGEKE